MTVSRPNVLLKFALPIFLAWGFMNGLATNAAAQASSQQIYLQCLTNFESYAETIWHPASYSGAPPDSGYWGDGGNSGNGGIRGNSGIAVAYAVLVLAQPGNPANSNRLAHIRQALNYDAGTHVTGSYVTINGGKWGWSSGSLATCTSQGGADWQSALWAGSMGLACLLVQSNLPASAVQAVQEAVASEADHRASIPPCTRILSDGDTKAEENAWDGNILALAAAWMTNNPSESNWLYAAKDYLANTYTLAYPDLITPDTAGDPLSNWISTVTLFPDWALENHGFYHPTYEMVAGMSSGDSLLMARLANTNIAAELQPFAEHNVMAVWQHNLQYMVMGSGEFAYPAGLDWELHDYEQDSYIAWMAAHFNDPLARWADGQLAQLVQYRQMVNGNGEFVGPSGGGFYREAVEARRTAIAWLQWAYADCPTGPANAPGPAVVQFPYVGVIAQRSASGFVSLSYGSRVMGMIEAAPASLPTNAYVATPALPGVFGVGPLGDPTSASLVSFATNADGFTAELLVQNGANGSTRVYVNSAGSAVGIVEVPLPANGVTGASAGCFTNGIENDPLTGGSRLLQWSGGSTTIANFSGVSKNIGSPWICVSGRYGVAAGPGASFQYQAASGYNRPGAAQDYLSVMPQTPLAPRYCVWFPSQNAEQTAASANQITWTTNGNTAVLTFPGPGGNTQTIVAVITSGNGTWIKDANGKWGDSSNWAGGDVADGMGATADFTTLNITADRTVTLDSSRSVGTLAFGDTVGTQNWALNSSNGSILTLAGSPPYIAVLENAATINASLAGTSGFTKAGPGTLVLSGANPLSGTLYLDTGSSSSSSPSDGAVRVTSSAALANVAALSIRNNTGDANGSTLQLDGADGNISVTQDLTASCRNNTVPNLENLAGTNAFFGHIYMEPGGTNIVIQSDAGVLDLDGALQYIGSFTAGRSFNFAGTGDTTVNGPILYSSVAPVSVGKWGTGTLTLSGNNSYNGETTVSEGTLNVSGSLADGAVNVTGGALGGTGTIGGPVTIFPGGTLTPGDQTIGSLTVNNSLTNEGTVSIRLDKSAEGLTNDSIRCTGTLAYGGTLRLVALGDPLTVGDSFQLFDATSYAGAFASLTPQTPGTGLIWNTNDLVANGTLSIALGNDHPQISQIALTGTNLIWSGSGGAAAAIFSVLSSTNLLRPLTNWEVIANGIFDTNGNFTLTNGLAPPFSQQFFLLRIP
jgi:autotransporter-associated beta strand protein